MFGIPGQTIWNLKESVRLLLYKRPTHISLYSLIVEDNTKLKDDIESGRKVLPSEKLEREMYWDIKKILENEGYEHYEISNFALKGYESKHNLNCWNQEEYIGFGVAAHGYINSIRYTHSKKLSEYIDAPGEISIEERQGEHEKKKEYMLLGLRKLSGVSISDFERKFQINPLFYFRFEISKLVEKELLEVDLDNIKLTKSGLDLANQVWMEFV